MKLKELLKQSTRADGDAILFEFLAIDAQISGLSQAYVRRRDAKIRLVYIDGEEARFDAPESLLWMDEREINAFSFCSAREVSDD